ncbi:MAG TPA: NUDIX hydrolase [Bradyrhizobium sp.]|nr:NUDIX hydrolase [Bradyrhizobium sp.]
MTPPRIHRVETLDLTVTPFAWPFEQARAEEIAAYFAGKQREKPKLWNGRVLLGRSPSFEGTHFSARYFEAGFASFLAWRDWGFPDPDIFNGFGMGALRASDGAFVLGEMGADTSNAGRIYFPAGTPDLDDVADDRLDLAGSITREIEEETGLIPADYRAAPHWDCVVSGRAIALMRTLHIDLPGEAVRARIEANLAAQAHPELAAVHLVRSRRDFTSTMPLFVTAFLETQFDES